VKLSSTAVLTALALAGIAAAPSSTATAETTITEDAWGALADGRAITRYTLTNASGAHARFMPLGAAILEVEAPDRNGTLADVALGFETAADYSNNGPQFGLAIGRYANRIAGARFTLDGETYELAAPPGRGGGPPRMQLHGGPDGFSKRLWTASRVTTADGPGIRFTIVSPDGDQGFPGELTLAVTYHWTDDFRLIVDYEATTTKTTVANFTQHSYFNLAGAGVGDILGHTLRIDADFYTFAAPDNLPTGEILSVKGTPFDFTETKPIGRDIESDNPHVSANRGYDINFVLRRSTIPGQTAEAAVLSDPASGRTMTVATTEPGMFLYTANSLDTERVMKGGVTYPVHAGVALETGHFPDSPNQPHFPSTTLLPGDAFRSRTVFAFSVR